MPFVEISMWKGFEESKKEKLVSFEIDRLKFCVYGVKFIRIQNKKEE